MRYHDAKSQLSMALDEHRNRQYEIALEKVITSESVVLDVGSGLGPFGLLAAKLGAKKVYFVEPETVVQSIKKVAQDNVLADNVVCLQGRIEDIKLPQKVDVITSCFTGNFLLSEDLLPSLFYARDHYLKPTGTLIPDSGTMIAVPVNAPKLYESYLEKLNEKHLGLDFSYYRRLLANMPVNNRTLKKTNYLSEPQSIQTLDFNTDTQAECDQSISFKINQSDPCHGVLGWFDMTLAGEVLSTGPEAPKVHWSRVWFPIDPPLASTEGDTLTVTIKKAVRENWSWIAETNGQKRVHSAALADAVIRKAKPISKPQLNVRGAQLNIVLNGFRACVSFEKIAEKLCHDWPNTFDQESALEFIEGWKVEYFDNEAQ